MSLFFPFSPQIVDFGCGKGYLSAMLALRHNANVFGLDSNEATVAAAMSRFGRMSKQWSALKKRLMTPPDVLKDTPGSLTVVPCVVRSDLNADSYVPSGENYLLCGLHTSVISIQCISNISILICSII